ncbi:MAG: adenylate/guanylate cyclase domain-containing protein [Acidimicrobiia bacterium]|nr:adenylate/guanylate cyclase domain-containing protein [Acidimicrobiia bacterium]
MERPETRYVAVGDADVAYQVLGKGGTDLIYCYGLGSHVDHFWDLPQTADFLAGLASFTRLVMFDRRGTGASDGVPSGAIPTWEEWAEDIGSVLNAAGSETAAFLATLDAGPMAILYAVSHPERVKALVLHNTTARYMAADDYPIGFAQEPVDFLIESMKTLWSRPEFAALVNPGMAGDQRFLDELARILRSSVTPRAAAAQYSYILQSLDVRDVLSLIQVPVLVLQVNGSPFLSSEHGRYLADHIDGAKFVELEGTDFYPGSNGSVVVAEVAEFLTGSRPVGEIDRVLASILVTDIVGSTRRAASLGDQRWRVLLDHHDAIVRGQLRRFQGREVNTTGDGFVASFDGPARAIRCALALGEAMKPLDVELHMSIHTGECEIRGDDLGGLAVHIAARVGALAAPREVLVSGTVKDLVVGSGIEFDDRGEHELKGVPGSWKLFAVKG